MSSISSEKKQELSNKQALIYGVAVRQLAVLLEQCEHAETPFGKFPSDLYELVKKSYDVILANYSSKSEDVISRFEDRIKVISRNLLPTEQPILFHTSTPASTPNTTLDPMPSSDFKQSDLKISSESGASAPSLSERLIQAIVESRTLASIGYDEDDFEEPFEYLADSIRETDYLAIKDFYLKLDDSEKRSFISAIVPLCLKSNNPFILINLFAADKQTKNSYAAEFCNSLSVTDQALAQKLLSISEIESPYKRNLLKQFIGYGHVKIDGALLVAADVKQRKEYAFTPTILGTDDFVEYLQLIKSRADSGSNEIFVIMDQHSFCGMVEIDKNRQAAIVFIDALGDKASNQDYINAFAQVFPYPHEIFQNSEKRLGIDGSCHIFALNDMLKLNRPYNLEDGFFNYLRSQKSTPTINKLEDGRVVAVTPCHLPLQLTRTMQSRNLYKSVIPSRSLEEQEQKINKKELTAQDCANMDFKMRNTTPQNQRLEQIRNKFFDKTLNIVNKLADSKIEEILAHATFSEFKARMQTKPLHESSTSAEENTSTSSTYKHSELSSQFGFLGDSKHKPPSPKATDKNTLPSSRKDDIEEEFLLFM